VESAIVEAGDFVFAETEAERGLYYSGVGRVWCAFFGADGGGEFDAGVEADFDVVEVFVNDGDAGAAFEGRSGREAIAVGESGGARGDDGAVSGQQSGELEAAVCRTRGRDGGGGGGSEDAELIVDDQGGVGDGVSGGGHGGYADGEGLFAQQAEIDAGDFDAAGDVDHGRRRGRGGVGDAEVAAIIGEVGSRGRELPLAADVAVAVEADGDALQRVAFGAGDGSADDSLRGHADFDAGYDLLWGEGEWGAVAGGSGSGVLVDEAGFLGDDVVGSGGRALEDEAAFLVSGGVSGVGEIGDREDLRADLHRGSGNGGPGDGGDAAFEAGLFRLGFAFGLTEKRQIGGAEDR
jgi:hypothetical protein